MLAAKAFAVMKTRYPRNADLKRLPPWLTKGARITPRFQTNVVYIIGEIQGRWARLDLEGRDSFLIKRVEVVANYTTHLNRFHRELEIECPG